VHSDYSRIHQRNFAIVNDDDSVTDVSLLVAKDLSKKIKKDPNSSSAAGKNIRVPFSSLEDGCGLIELCKHDVWPLPCDGEYCSITKMLPLIESKANGADSYRGSGQCLAGDRKLHSPRGNLQNQVFIKRCRRER
jgi:hypothetical protein